MEKIKTNYSLWRGRIKEFLLTIDFELRFVMKLGYKGPIKNTNEIIDIDQLKDIPKEEKRAMSIDAKAKDILACALTRQEYNRVCNCETAKQMWDMLQITHEGIKQVRQERIIILTNQYEMFQMLPSEDIEQMYTHLMDLIHPLSFPYHWTPKVTAIQEAKDLSTITIYEFIGSLTSHEITLLNKDRIPNSKENKNIAFNTEHDTEKETRDEQDDSEFDEELAMITKRIQRLGNFQSKTQKIKSNKKGSPLESQKTVTVGWYECKEIGHIKSKCPKLKKNQKEKGKAVASTWDNSDNEFQNEEERLMAGEEKCPIKGLISTKFIWVPKFTTSNTKGPNEQ
ncbi:hypothetical protein CDL12_05199 [Handroanthus impetiginosus]|uniref:CCHC-type domain-containing protein n=1 Tax=Handroanthus impetiginosus TaxID=429701 RepID=A0A2G9HX78_9LAMI|nr:hypothetical protein CDL12_05199 [Handroanthus impetiginosus]